MIVLDTGFFKGLMDNRDRHHKEALKIEKYLRKHDERTLINTTILIETINWTAGTDISIKQLYNNLITDNKFVELSKKDYLESLKVNGWYGNNINYSDCTIINTMLNEHLNRIISFDGDFKKIKGFKVIDNIHTLKETLNVFKIWNQK